MKQTSAEKAEQFKQFLLVGLVALVSVGVLGGWFFYIKPKLRPARAENAQHPYFMKYMDSQTKLRGDFNREMSQIAWQNVLDFTQMDNDPGLKSRLFMVEKAKRAVVNYRKASAVLDDEAMLELVRMPGSEEDKKAAQASYLKLTAEPRKMVSRTWEMEGLVVAEVEKILKLMAPEPRAWSIIKDKVMFDVPGDQKEFDACLARVAALSAEQEVLRAEAIESTLKKQEK